MSVRKGRRSASLSTEEFEELLAIGTALAAERDLDRLLTRILEQSRRILKADAGSLFLIERSSTRDEPTHLRFKLAQNDSIEFDFREFSIPIDTESLVGYVAKNREPIRLDDVYKIPASAPFRFNKDFDQKTGYRSMSLLAVPLTDHQDRVIGVAQLWNKKKRPSIRLTPQNVSRQVVPFTASDHKLLESLSSQAAVAIENARLYGDIRQLFEGFIRASVLAIESRDPTTSGHSERVSTLTLGLAEEVDQTSSGVYADVHFSSESLRELQYAALLHDFGKIGVREPVLVKNKKLYPMEWEAIRDRFHLLYRTIELEGERRKLSLLESSGEKIEKHWETVEARTRDRLAALDHALALVGASNEPTVLPEAVSAELSELANLRVQRPDGSTDSILTPEQIVRLSVPKGSLSLEERLEIESHVTHTYKFLSKIPWTRELQQIPDIAYAHHEKLDGSGYPQKIESHLIPFPSKIMTVADIFDALVARDRPYKKAVAVSNALDILNMEASGGQLDSELVQIFINKKVYLRTTDS